MIINNITDMYNIYFTQIGTQFSQMCNMDTSFIFYISLLCGVKNGVKLPNSIVVET